MYGSQVEIATMHQSALATASSNTCSQMHVQLNHA